VSSTARREALGKLKDLVTPMLSIIAIGLSSYSLYVSERTHQDVARSDAIKTQRELSNNLARAELDNPLLSHLFAVTGDAYDERSARVAKAVAKLDPDAKAKLLLQETAMAHYIFASYEETYLIWEHAQQVEDTSRASLLRGALNLFNDQLCNRRLLWFWDIENGNKLGLGITTRVQTFYQSTVIKDCTEEADPEGPFNLDTNGPKKKNTSRRWN
jgi:hypothetical protein